MGNESTRDATHCDHVEDTPSEASTAATAADPVTDGDYEESSYQRLAGRNPFALAFDSDSYDAGAAYGQQNFQYDVLDGSGNEEFMSAENLMENSERLIRSTIVMLKEEKANNAEEEEELPSLMDLMVNNEMPYSAEQLLEQVEAVPPATISDESPSAAGEQDEPMIEASPQDYEQADEPMPEEDCAPPHDDDTDEPMAEDDCRTGEAPQLVDEPMPEAEDTGREQERSPLVTEESAVNALPAAQPPVDASRKVLLARLMDRQMTESPKTVAEFDVSVDGSDMEAEVAADTSVSFIVHDALMSVIDSVVDAVQSVAEPVPVAATSTGNLPRRQSTQLAETPSAVLAVPEIPCDSFNNLVDAAVVQDAMNSMLQSVAESVECGNLTATVEEENTAPAEDGSESDSASSSSSSSSSSAASSCSSSDREEEVTEVRADVVEELPPGSISRIRRKRKSSRRPRNTKFTLPEPPEFDPNNPKRRNVYDRNEEVDPEGWYHVYLLIDRRGTPLTGYAYLVSWLDSENRFCASWEWGANLNTKPLNQMKRDVDRWIKSSMCSTMSFEKYYRRFGEKYTAAGDGMCFQLALRMAGYVLKIPDLVTWEDMNSFELEDKSAGVSDKMINRLLDHLKKRKSKLACSRFRDNFLDSSTCSIKQLKTCQLDPGVYIVGAYSKALIGHCFVIQVFPDGSRVAYDDLHERKCAKPRFSVLNFDDECLSWITSIRFVRVVEQVVTMSDLRRQHKSLEIRLMRKEERMRRRMKRRKLSRQAQAQAKKIKLIP